MLNSPYWKRDKIRHLCINSFLDCWKLNLSYCVTDGLCIWLTVFVFCVCIVYSGYRILTIDNTCTVGPCPNPSHIIQLYPVHILNSQFNNLHVTATDCVWKLDPSRSLRSVGTQVIWLEVLLFLGRGTRQSHSRNCPHPLQICSSASDAVRLDQSGPIAGLFLGHRTPRRGTLCHFWFAPCSGRVDPTLFFDMLSDRFLKLVIIGYSYSFLSSRSVQWTMAWFATWLAKQTNPAMTWPNTMSDLSQHCLTGILALLLERASWAFKFEHQAPARQDYDEQIEWHQLAGRRFQRMRKCLACAWAAISAWRPAQSFDSLFTFDLLI